MFKVLICSDLDYEEVVADICWNDDGIATIIQDKGIEDLEIIFHLNTDEQCSSQPFPLEDFINTLQKAKNTLRFMQKIDSD